MCAVRDQEGAFEPGVQAQLWARWARYGLLRVTVSTEKRRDCGKERQKDAENSSELAKSRPTQACFATLFHAAR